MTEKSELFGTKRNNIFTLSEVLSLLLLASPGGPGASLCPLRRGDMTRMALKGHWVNTDLCEMEYVEIMSDGIRETGENPNLLSKSGLKRPVRVERISTRASPCKMASTRAGAGPARGHF